MKFNEIITEKRYPRMPSTDALAAAKQAGFEDKLWYHGTRRRFDDFQAPKKPGFDELGPGIYVTSKRWLANTWARKGGFILTCLIRHGSLFDLAHIDRPETMPILRKGYRNDQTQRWGTFETKDDGYDAFLSTWNDSRNRAAFINLCLSGAGYIGAFKHNSQIEGQAVIFKPEDVMIIARTSGQDYLSSFDEASKIIG